MKHFIKISIKGHNLDTMQRSIKHPFIYFLITDQYLCPIVIFFFVVLCYKIVTCLNVSTNWYAGFDLDPGCKSSRPRASRSRSILAFSALSMASTLEENEFQAAVLDEDSSRLGLASALLVCPFTELPASDLDRKSVEKEFFAVAGD